MPVASTLADRLDAFLASRQVTREMLVAAASGTFGPPLLVVATGSILQGFGNPSSDVDLSAVVPDRVPRLSLTSHAAASLVDTTYFGAADVEPWVAAVRDTAWPPAGAVSREHRDRREVQLRYCTRFRDGIALSARDGWDRWIAAFHEPWLARSVADWWRVEAMRRHVAARWLLQARPLLSAQRAFDAVLGALEFRAATAGHVYFAPKWIVEKMRAAGDAHGLERLRSVTTMPATARDVEPYVERCDAIVRELGVGPDPGLSAQLWYVAGVAVRRLDARWLVERWGLRGLESKSDIPEVPRSPAPIWQGALADHPPDAIAALFVHDFTWLTIATAPGGPA